MTVRLTAGVALVVAALITAEKAPAASFGPSAMPSRVAQYFGCGYGAGHHAPIVRTPGQHPHHAPRYVRVPRAAGPLYPAPYVLVGCYGEACHGGPTPTPQPALVPEVAPTEDRHAWRFFQPVTPENQSPRNF